MKKENKFGLPSEVKYCVKCNVINQRPTSTNEYLHDKFTKQIPICKKASKDIRVI